MFTEGGLGQLLSLPKALVCLPPSLLRSCLQAQVLLNEGESPFLFFFFFFTISGVPLLHTVGILCAFKSFDLIHFAFMKKLELH